MVAIMNIAKYGSYLLDSMFGKYVLDATTRLFYLSLVRKPLVHAVDRLLQESRFWDGPDRAGWHKIQQQYREVSLAVLHSLDRAIEKRILAPHVARLIFDLWGRAFFHQKNAKSLLSGFVRVLALRRLGFS